MLSLEIEELLSLNEPLCKTEGDKILLLAFIQQIIYESIAEKMRIDFGYHRVPRSEIKFMDFVRDMRTVIRHFNIMLNLAKKTTDSRLYPIDPLSCEAEILEEILKTYKNV